MSSSVRIIPYYAHPHVHTVINDYTWYDETVATPKDPQDLPYATAICAGADQGIDNTWVRLSDLETKQAIFGKGNYNKYGQASLQADQLFNGYTNVWFLRPLPDNATYANLIVLAHIRKGNILDELNQETGRVRMEIKFSTAYATKPGLTDGALTDEDIEAYANSLMSKTSDPQTGYMTIPLLYVRSIGRGKYGNSYSMKFTRDTDAEKEYDIKMYGFSLLTHSTITRITNIFSGSLYQTSRYNMSTLVSDVLDQYATGSCPVFIRVFEDNFEYLYDFYQDNIVAANATYLNGSSATAEELLELTEAQNITIDTFDPLFGRKINTRSDEVIPYYRNYTVREEGVWVAPELTIPNEAGAQKPLNVSEWTTAAVGSRVLMIADPLHEGMRWMYTVTSIDVTTGNIIYDEGESVDIDADQYDGINLQVPVGLMLDGGYDGDFQEISVGGVMRAPTNAEMKLLLSKEYVKAWRGEKDRKILSPARVNIDFLFDANYNMTAEEDLQIDSYSSYLYNNSTVLTDKDAQQLAVLGGEGFIADFSDLNVKKAMYDLNEFRNKNGMTLNLERGAGCLLHLDCNLTGLSSVKVNTELLNIMDMMEYFDGRNTSIDFGYYHIFDPVTHKKIPVTVTYYIAQNLVPHIMKYGLNKPFTMNYATIRAIQSNASTFTTTGSMIRDTFRPDIDLIDWDVKERLFKSRINYWLTTDEGRTVQRACQNTRQLDASALLEENNVRVLNALKKDLEKACTGYLFEWNEPEVRRGYTEAQMEKFRPWIGTMVQDLDIKFTADEWEQERMIMHCLVEVAFRDIVKRIILEINIQRPDYSETSTGGDE